FKFPSCGCTFCSYLGNEPDDYGLEMKLDEATGDLYLTGGVPDTSFSGDNDIFVAKLHMTQTITGTTWTQAKYRFIGGTGNDSGWNLDVDSSGSPYITGFTQSNDFPLVKPINYALRGGLDGIVVKLLPDFSNLVYSTYLGGSSTDISNGIAVDSNGV